MGTQLTEAQAWREVARQIEVNEWQGSGLCIEIPRLYYSNRIRYETLDRMRNRLHAHERLWAETALGDAAPSVGWYWPRGAGIPRIIACELLALEAEEEEGQ